MASFRMREKALLNKTENTCVPLTPEQILSTTVEHPVRESLSHFRYASECVTDEEPSSLKKQKNEQGCVSSIERENIKKEKREKREQLNTATRKIAHKHRVEKAKSTISIINMNIAKIVSRQKILYEKLELAELHLEELKKHFDEEEL